MWRENLRENLLIKCKGMFFNTNIHLGKIYKGKLAAEVLLRWFCFVGIMAEKIYVCNCLQTKSRKAEKYVSDTKVTTEDYNN